MAKGLAIERCLPQSEQTHLIEVVQKLSLDEFVLTKVQSCTITLLSSQKVMSLTPLLKKWMRFADIFLPHFLVEKSCRFPFRIVYIHACS